jgi:Tol biopolymer transport system component
VQPDGLWIRALPDGKAAKIVSGAGLHEPRFSPSGAWISYRNRVDDLAVVSSGGKAGAFWKGQRAAWLPRENRLAIQRDHDVAVFGPANGWKSPVALWKDAGLPLASPDAKLYAAKRIHERPSSPDGLYQATAELYAASVAAPHKARVLLSNEGAIQPYAWTRDGKAILYWRSDDGWSASVWSDGVDLYSIPASGGAERKLGVTALAHDDILEMAPESAGNRFAVTRGSHRETWSDQTIAVVDLDTGAVRDLTAGNIAALCPAWSPDARSIACFAAPGVEDVGGGEEAQAALHQRKIWLLDPAGAAPPRQLTGDVRYRDEEPLWSADGSHILFGRMDSNAHTSLWLTEASGARLAQICPLKIYHPLEGDKDSWFGYYGYLDWRSAFDWRRS